MHTKTVLLALMVTLVCVSGTAMAADDQAVVDDSQNFNLMGYIILGFALVGWAFFLCLLGGAIMLIVKKARKPYVPKNPVKCK